MINGIVAIRILADSVKVTEIFLRYQYCFVYTSYFLIISNLLPFLGGNIQARLNSPIALDTL